MSLWESIPITAMISAFLWLLWLWQNGPAVRKHASRPLGAQASIKRHRRTGTGGEALTTRSHHHEAGQVVVEPSPPVLPTRIQTRML